MALEATKTQVAMAVGPGLLRAVTELAAQLQQAKTVDELLALAGAGLEALGFDVAVLSLTRDQTWFQYVSARPPLSKVAEAVGLVRGGAPGEVPNPMLLPTPLKEGRAFLAELPLAVARWLGRPGEALEGLKRRGLVAPLHVGARAWGGIVFMHDELEPAEADLLSLFALQLGSAIDLMDHAERLQQREAELELVHQLAIAGPRTDAAAMCQRALALVCRATRSDAGVLHRYDAVTGEYQLVGNSHAGELGVLEEKFARYPAPGPAPTRPRCLSVEELPLGREDLARAGFSFLAVVPLPMEGAPAALLTLGRQGCLPYGELDLRSAEILGAQMTSLVERTRVYDETRRLLRVSVEAYDEQARTQADVVRHEKLVALGELAAVMAHEVRNPLGVIFNSLTTLKRLIHPTGDTEMLLNMVEEEAERLNRIVTDLLDFVRPYELTKRPLAIGPVIEAAVAQAFQALETVTVRVVTEVDPSLPPFPADVHLLKQAIVNLVVNAVQAMPKGGTVTVRSSLMPRPDGSWLEVAVSDEGPGLAPRAAEKMFQPFFTTKATGTGLGLAVVKRIIESHQGEVVVASNPGRGTTFTLRIPPAYDRETPAGGLRAPLADVP